MIITWNNYYIYIYDIFYMIFMIFDNIIIIFISFLMIYCKYDLNYNSWSKMISKYLIFFDDSILIFIENERK